MTQRLQTGIPDLDQMLGGGLLPGTLTIVLGATGIGKTQLGLQFAYAGRQQEGETGIFFDMTSRGDSQSHADYARRMFDWTLQARSAEFELNPAALWDRDHARCDCLHIFQHAGRRVSLSDLDEDARREWQADINRRLERTIAFFYGNFVHGVRRCVIDGVEPVEKASDSFQLEVMSYVQRQILQKDADWVARDLLRAQFREHETQVRQHHYDRAAVGTLLLCTSHEVLLDDLISRPIQTGDLLSNANTIILMGKVRNGTKLGRALQIAKHRNSACDESIMPYQIETDGLRLLP